MLLLSFRLEEDDGVEKALRESRFAHRARKGECVLSTDHNGRLVADRITKVNTLLHQT